LIVAVNDVFFDTVVLYHDCNSTITTCLWFYAVLCLPVVGLRALSFKRPLLSVDVDVCEYVSRRLRSNMSENKGDRGSVTMGSL